MLNAHAKIFNDVLEESKKELYPGCKNSVLSFIVKLYHSKCIGKSSEKGFIRILDTLRETFPDASLPKSFYEMKKVIRDLGLSYDKIDACPNDYSPAWKTFDFNIHDFAKEPRNVRLGLASDGFNPFGNMTPGNNIDVYLEPLLEELKELWDDGVETYDASTKTKFEMHASLLWTISDYPAYANLSRWSTKERIFTPSFFDVMIHLFVHLASEAKIGGPVHYRWMYPVERYLSILKSYVQNKSRPKGSIAEGYIVEECLSFCSLYLSPDIETEHNRTCQNYDDGGSVKVIEFINEHTLQCQHSETATEWFQDHIEKLHMMGDQRIIEELRVLANDLAEVVKNYEGFIINGFRFKRKELESKRKTQNSRVMLLAMKDSFSSSKDNNPIVGDVTYYRVINDIIELEYSTNKKVVLFDCDWISNGRRKKEDENGFTLLNFKGLKPHNKHFILASQAQQVFYIADPVDKGWKVVIKTTTRDSFNMIQQTCDDDVEIFLQSNTSSDPSHDESIDIS
ncbi:uncharacterized protein Tco_1404916 [Tanacetum coccineum]